MVKLESKKNTTMYLICFLKNLLQMNQSDHFTLEDFTKWVSILKWVSHNLSVVICNALMLALHCWWTGKRSSAHCLTPSQRKGSASTSTLKDDNHYHGEQVLSLFLFFKVPTFTLTKSYAKFMASLADPRHTQTEENTNVRGQMSQVRKAKDTERCAYGKRSTTCCLCASWWYQYLPCHLIHPWFSVQQLYNI